MIHTLKKILNYFFVKKTEDVITFGETELDYLPQEEITKKKRATKTKSEKRIIHPQVKMNIKKK